MPDVIHRGHSAPDVDPVPKAPLYLALLAALRGTIFLYQGEELGLPQSAIAFEDLQDPFGKAHWPLDKGRDGCRTPMPWQSASPHAGFSSAAPWLPADPAHRALAVDAQESDPSSALHFTRRLLELRRRHAALRLGSFDLERVDDTLLVARRGHGDDHVWLAFNLGNAARELPAPATTRVTLLALEPARLHRSRIELPPYSAIFLQLAP
jgi:alpha-glucosidase